MHVVFENFFAFLLLWCFHSLILVFSLRFVVGSSREGQRKLLLALVEWLDFGARELFWAYMNFTFFLAEGFFRFWVFPVVDSKRPADQLIEETAKWTQIGRGV
jgi:hypothetical protein